MVQLLKRFLRHQQRQFLLYTCKCCQKSVTDQLAGEKPSLFYYLCMRQNQLYFLLCFNSGSSTVPVQYYSQEILFQLAFNDCHEINSSTNSDQKMITKSNNFRDKSFLNIIKSLKDLIQKRTHTVLLQNRCAVSFFPYQNDLSLVSSSLTAAAVCFSKLLFMMILKFTNFQRKLS